MIAIFFFYGLAFFLMGLAIYVYPKGESEFALVRHLWLISAFGIIHGINEWLDMFMLINAPDKILPLQIIALFVLPLSFLFLIKFGAITIIGIKKKYSALNALPLILFILWGCVTILSKDIFLLGNIWARYLLGVTGIFLTSYAIILIAAEFKKQKFVSVARDLKIAAGAFFVYGILSGLIVSKAGFFPASIFNCEAFFNLTRVPSQLFRALCALIIAYSMIRFLGIFNWETKQKIASLLARTKESRDKLESRVKERTKDLNLANAQLTKEKIFSDSVINSLPGIFYLFDTNANFLRWNKNVEIVSKYSAEELSGMCMLDFFVEKDKKLVFESIQRVMRDGESVVEAGLISKDGKVVPYFLTGLRLTVDNERYLVGMGIDITERRKAEAILRRDKDTFEKLVAERTKELVDTQAELHKAKRLSDIGMLAAVVAHELRNPLAAIEIAAYNIKHKNKNALLDRHLYNITKKIAESNQIISNLLFYSRLRKPDYSDVDIIEILEECIASVKQMYPASNIYITRIFHGLNIFTIAADPVQMRELFSNIINNSFDALRGTLPELLVSLARIDCDNIKIQFQDNGCGISEKVLSRIYDPFFTTKAKGTGLGLAVCSQIVNLHNGKLKITSQDGKGTTVTVILPIKQNRIRKLKK